MLPPFLYSGSQLRRLRVNVLFTILLAAVLSCRGTTLSLVTHPTYLMAFSVHNTLTLNDIGFRKHNSKISTYVSTINRYCWWITCALIITYHSHITIFISFVSYRRSTQDLVHWPELRKGGKCSLRTNFSYHCTIVKAITGPLPF